LSGCAILTTEKSHLSWPGGITIQFILTLVTSLREAVSPICSFSLRLARDGIPVQTRQMKKAARAALSNYPFPYRFSGLIFIEIEIAIGIVL
jgi:hypothetical protein